MFRKCQHKFGVVDDKGYQYCQLCGKAELIGIPKCSHNWKTINTLTSQNIYTDHTSYYIYIQQCNKCGEIKQIKTI
jgi:hypothetical protein